MVSADSIVKELVTLITNSLIKGLKYFNKFNLVLQEGGVKSGKCFLHPLCIAERVDERSDVGVS